MLHGRHRDRTRRNDTETGGTEVQISEQVHDGQAAAERTFRWATVAFAIALALHGADHLRRGMDVVPHAVMVAGTVQIVFAVITVVLVFRGSSAAPYFAFWVGAVSAIGFTLAHLLPEWGFFSDSFINAPPEARVTWFSWVSALLEIVADTVLALAAYRLVRTRRVMAASLAR
jgi:hypothetical protein